MEDDLGIARIAQPILVTGSNGFLGRHLMQRLLAAGVRPRAFVLDGTPIPGEWSGRVDVVTGDIATAADVRHAVEGCRTIFHLAAIVGDWGPEEAYRRVTVGGTESVFAAAAGSGARVVLASSVVVYGDLIARRECAEDAGFGTPCGPYGRAKQEQERIARRFEGKVPFAIVRPGNVYGPGSGPWLHDLLDLLRNPGLPALVDGGAGNAGLAHVENVVDVLLLAAWREEALGQAFNAADELDVTWRRYFTDVAALVGQPTPRSIPGWAARLAADVGTVVWRTLGLRGRPPLTREALALIGHDNRFPQRKARALLGYTPRVGYAEALRGIAEYVRRLERGDVAPPVRGRPEGPAPTAP